MSGGAYDYFSLRMRAIEIKNNGDPRRTAFKKLFALVADAMYEIEWVDSGDNPKGYENDAIDKCLNFNKGDV